MNKSAPLNRLFKVTSLTEPALFNAAPRRGDQCFIPFNPEHPGSFGAVRKHHRHEGIDLYAGQDEFVFNMVDGHVVAVIPHFTGPEAGSPWWNTTGAIMVEDNQGVWLYGEIRYVRGLHVGARLRPGEIIGTVEAVLKQDKGRPMAMLHLERYDRNVRTHVGSWGVGVPQPEGLRDPTFELMRVLDLMPAVLGAGA